MKHKLLRGYPYLAPVILAPLSFWLWWRMYDGSLWLTMAAWLLPVVFAYIVPGIGTNVLKVWEFDTRFRLGRFRPQHGFVFGSATSLLAWVIHSGNPVSDWQGVLQLSFVMASVLGFWNLLYDVKAIAAGILHVYNQPWAEGKGVEAIAFDYAPCFFASFGAVYGAGLGIAECLAVYHRFDGMVFTVWFSITLLTAIAVPVYIYRRRSLSLHGHDGCHPVDRCCN